jgi:3-hydroxybutyryl-CoA dehydratase
VTYYLDEIRAGQSESSEHTVTERDVQLFGEATGDMNPIHFDEAAARRSIFRGRVAHGALSIGFISALLGTKIPGEGSIFLSASIAFKTPVRIGDTVVTKATVREVVGREAVMDCVCTVQGRLVLESEARVLIPRRPGTKPPDAADPTASKAASA